MNPASLIRHSLSFLAGLGTILGAWLWLQPGQLEALNKAGSDLIEPAVIIFGIIGAVLFRMLIAWAGKLLRIGAGEETKDSAGGLFPCVLAMCMAAALMGFGLPSCTPAQLDAARAIPIRIGIQGPDAAVSYSSKSGLAVDAVIRAEK